MAALGKLLAPRCALDPQYLNLRDRERRQAAVLHRGRTRVVQEHGWRL